MVVTCPVARRVPKPSINVVCYVVILPLKLFSGPGDGITPKMGQVLVAYSQTEDTIPKIEDTYTAYDT